MNNNDSIYGTVVATFLASVKSVGTACTLASVGIYLHQRGFVVGNGKRTLALISQQVTIPLLFFTKILYCNQDWSEDPCPDVTSSLRDVWILAVWPLWVCTMGICVGHCVVRLAAVDSNTDSLHQRNSILAAVAFGNSTGLPITLLTVIHSNFGASSALGSVDPTLFLSVYLVLYPVLQWGIGGVLLAPPESNDRKMAGSGREQSGDRSKNKGLPMSTPPSTRMIESGEYNGNGGGSMAHQQGPTQQQETQQYIYQHTPLTERQLSFKSTIKKSIKDAGQKTKQTLANNVVHNTTEMPETYRITHRGLESTDASMYWSVQENLNRWGKPLWAEGRKGSFYQFGGSGGSSNDHGVYSNSDSGCNIGMDLSGRESIPEEEGHSANDGEVYGVGMDLSGQDSIPEEDDDNENIVTTTFENCDPPYQAASETTSLLGTTHADATPQFASNSDGTGGEPGSTPLTRSASESSTSSGNSSSQQQLLDTFLTVAKRCLQPPVVAALLGLLFASLPAIRGVFVDIVDRNGTAPLQWFFDGLYEAGKAAVPINMIILGCNLSASYMLETKAKGGGGCSGSGGANREKRHGFSTRTTLLVVFGKMVAMPVVGMLSTLALDQIYDVPHDIAGGLYLVLLIVFLCPTANNVMVMVELSGGSGIGNTSGGGSMKESMAKVIAYEYALAPIVLSMTVTGAVLMASYMASRAEAQAAEAGILG